MKVNDKVVCINDKFHPQIAQFYTALPQKGKTYVIRNVCLGVSPENKSGEVCLHLVGLNNPKSTKPPHPERGFSSERFVPLDEYRNRNNKNAHRESPAELVEVPALEEL